MIYTILVTTFTLLNFSVIKTTTKQEFINMINNAEFSIIIFISAYLQRGKIHEEYNES